MQAALLASFCHPDNGSPLRLTGAAGADVRQGALRDRNGAAVATIVDGVPDFVTDGDYTGSFGLQWQRFPKTQLDSWNGSSYSRDRLLATAGWSGDADLAGRCVLEVGSGAGRFTEVFAASGATVFSFDYSTAAFANQRNNGHWPNVAIFRADLRRIPLRKATFEIVCCLGVLQHTPDVAESFRAIASMVAPGGQLVVDAYSRSLRQRLHWKYLLRPLSTRVAPERLFRFCDWYVPKLLPAAAAIGRVARPLSRLVPVMDQSAKKLPPDVYRDWSVLDTFDALAAKYDQPQSAATLKRWFDECGFRDVVVTEGTIVRARGRRYAA